MLRYVFAFSIVMAFATVTYAADRYVHCENGNDGATGTQDAPYRTIQRAFDVVRPGETIYIHTDAVCRVTKGIKTVRNGPVTVTSYGGGDNIWKLRGSELLNSGWSSQGSNRWRHPVSNDPGRMVFFDRDNQASWADINGGRSGAGSCPSDLNSEKEFCYSGGFLYVHSASNPGTRFTNPGVEVVDDLFSQSTANSRLLAINHANHTLMNGDIRHAGDNVINITAGGDNTIFDRMTVEYSRLHGLGPGGQGAGTVNIITNNGTISAVVFRNSRVANCGRDCIHPGSNNQNYLQSLTIENTEIANGFNHGALGGTANVGTLTITRSYIHDTCDGVYVGNVGKHGTDNIIITDTIFANGVLNNGDPRLFMGASCSATVSVGIASNGSPRPQTLTLRRNIIRGWTIGIDTFNMGNTTLVAENNVFYGNLHAGMDVSKVTNFFSVRNNIYSQNGSSPNSFDGQIVCRNSSACSKFTSKNFANVDNNLYDPHTSSVVAYINQSGQGDRTFAQWKAVTGADAKSMHAAPDFANAATGNFNLQPTSPARSAASTGEDIGTVLTWTGSNESGEVATTPPPPGNLKLLKPM